MTGIMDCQVHCHVHAQFWVGSYCSRGSQTFLPYRRGSQAETQLQGQDYFLDLVLCDELLIFCLELPSSVHKAANPDICSGECFWDSQSAPEDQKAHLQKSMPQHFHATVTINAKNLGDPVSRRRIYFVGVLRLVFPFIVSDQSL